MTRLTEDLLLLAHTDESRFIRREPIPLEPFLAELIESAAPDHRPRSEPRRAHARDPQRRP